MSPSIWRLAMAGCIFGAVFVAPAGLAAVDGFAQPIQNLPKINLLQTVTHISNGLGKKDVEPKTISRTDNWRFVMASTARKVDQVAQAIPQKLTGVAAIDGAAESLPGLYYVNRTNCMSGATAQLVDERRELSGIPDEGWDVNDFCMRVLEVSAGHEKKLQEIAAAGRKPDALYDRPDKGLLEPYKAIAKDKGIQPSRANAEMAVNLYLQTLHKPGVGEQTGKVSIPLTNGQQLTLVPGVAFDVAFTKRVMDAYKNPGAPLPAPTETLAEVAVNAEKVFRNQNIRLDQSERSGDNLGIHFLNRNRQVAQNVQSQR